MTKQVNNRNQPEQEQPRVLPDFHYKRCYIDMQGNTIDPRTSWDELLKYYAHYRRLLGVGAESRRMSASTPAQALKLIIAEKHHLENKRKLTNKQARDLIRKEQWRKRQKRKRIEQKEASYLKQQHERH